jgi:replicative DNA helicase
VAVDLITQLKDFMHNKSNQSVANSIETAMNDLNALAKELNVHIIGVAQFNRDADNMKVLTADDLDMLRPSLNNIKNSHALAERSRVVLSLFRKKYYSDRYLPADEAAKVEEDILEVNILKNSSGMVGNTLHYLFDGSHFKVLPILDPLPTSTDVELVY